LDVCRAIRANPATAGIAVLVVSGWTFESDIAAVHAAGADGYLAKPFAAADLRSLVLELIDRAATRSGGGSGGPVASASATAPADRWRSPRPPGSESV
jgi:DNA-binding response OmpR family regulator